MIRSARAAKVDDHLFARNTCRIGEGRHVASHVAGRTGFRHAVNGKKKWRKAPRKPACSLCISSPPVEKTRPWLSLSSSTGEAGLNSKAAPFSSLAMGLMGSEVVSAFSSTRFTRSPTNSCSVYSDAAVINVFQPFRIFQLCINRQRQFRAARRPVVSVCSTTGHRWHRCPGFQEGIGDIDDVTLVTQILIKSLQLRIEALQMPLSSTVHSRELYRHRPSAPAQKSVRCPPPACGQPGRSGSLQDPQHHPRIYLARGAFPPPGAASRLWFRWLVLRPAAEWRRRRQQHFLVMGAVSGGNGGGQGKARARAIGLFGLGGSGGSSTAPIAQANSRSANSQITTLY